MTIDINQLEMPSSSKF